MHGKLISSVIEAKDGGLYSVDFYILDRSLGNSYIRGIIPQILRVAILSFPHWDDNGRSFFQQVSLHTNTFSVIKNTQNETVGFHMYTRGQVNDATFLYLNYSGVDPAEDEHGVPKYRRKGLIVRSGKSDVFFLQPDILIGCSSVGEIHTGIKRFSDETGRVMYPTGLFVPAKVGVLAKKIYGMVNGIETEDSVDTKTLVRHGTTAYAKGKVDYPLFDTLEVGVNDGLIFMSLKKSFNDQLLRE